MVASRVNIIHKHCVSKLEIMLFEPFLINLAQFNKPSSYFLHQNNICEEKCIYKTSLSDTIVKPKQNITLLIKCNRQTLKLCHRTTEWRHPWPSQAEYIKRYHMHSKKKQKQAWRPLNSSIVTFQILEMMDSYSWSNNLTNKG